MEIIRVDEEGITQKWHLKSIEMLRNCHRSRKDLQVSKKIDKNKVEESIFQVNWQFTFLFHFNFTAKFR